MSPGDVRRHPARPRGGGRLGRRVRPHHRAAGPRRRGLRGAAARARRESEARALLGRVGHHRVRLDEAERRVSLDGTRLVLDALAKGDAADRAVAAVRASGATERPGRSRGKHPRGVRSAAHRGPARPVRRPAALGIVPPRRGRPRDLGRRPAARTHPRPAHRRAGDGGAPGERGGGTRPRGRCALDRASSFWAPTRGWTLLARRGAAGLVLLIEDGRPRHSDHARLCERSRSW